MVLEGSTKQLHVVLDLDETITAHPLFFSWLSSALRRDGHRVTVLTLRRSRETTIRDLEARNITWDVLLVLPMDYDGDIIQWKLARVCELQPDVVVDDLVEFVNQVDPSIFVLVPRDQEMGPLARVMDG